MNRDHELMQRMQSILVDHFKVTGDDVRFVRSPYRICPLGAHIDHQLGPVTAMAINRGVWLAFAPTDHPEIRMVSLDFPGQVRCSLNAIPDRLEGEWGNFPRGAARALSVRHPLDRGLVGVTSGRLDGGGLSSSAAVGVACLLALEHVNGLDVTPKENIRLHGEIENGYLGLRIGILDQAAVLLSRKDHLVAIDCDRIEYTLHRRPTGTPPFRILIASSGVQRALTGTDYNRRVTECQEAARRLLDEVGRTADRPVLGKLSYEEFRRYEDCLTPVGRRRAEHFYSEVSRVGRGIDAWQCGDLVRFGQLMTQSGRSSIKNYECGSPPLIRLFELLAETKGVFGARFSGAGFRGCCVALVEGDLADEAVGCVNEEYARDFPDLFSDAGVFLCDSANGAEVVSGSVDDESDA